MDFQQNVLLKNYSNYKIGGPASLFVEVKSIEELREVLKSVRDGSGRIFILGGGTNLLIADEGFNGLVIFNKITGLEKRGTDVIVGTGVMIKDLLDFCVENSLTGLEWAGGLPGTVGGAVRGNAGAFKGEIKDSVVQVKSLDLPTSLKFREARKTLNEKIRNNQECKFGYRNSIFKTDENEFITSVILRLSQGDKEEIRVKIQEKINYRNNRHPIDKPSIGSTFKNIPLDSLSEDLQKKFAPFVKTDPFPIVPTTKLLALSNLKGKRVGGAMISDKHPNFIVNIDNASSHDIKALIEIAKQTIKEKYGIDLVEEIKYLE